MKPYTALGAITLLASTSVLADPAADSGLVSVFSSQTALLNIVNVGDTAKTCSFTLSFIDSTGAVVPSPLVVSGLASGASASLIVGPAAYTTLMRAHIDFTAQLVANAGQLDPMDGCYHLIPTFEVTDATSTQVLNTQFYDMPSPEKGKKLEKIKICHKPGTPAQKTLEVPLPALQGHLGHGDTVGACAG